MVSTTQIPTASGPAATLTPISPYAKPVASVRQGTVYFVRHGESTSNERNIFAGVLDVELTTFGKMQARQAGYDIKKKGVIFDAVYVSHLKRARQTCDIALAMSGALKSPDIEPQIDHRISEKSFGIFAQRNKNLLRLALGYDGFEELLHSHNETPPSGESIQQVYDRVAQFYEDEIVPRLERGENVLVVCHQYVLEPLALYLSGLPATKYHHLKLPNGKALSREALVNFQHKESSGAASLRKKVNDLATMWGIGLSAVAFIAGVVIKSAMSAIATTPTDQLTIPATLFAGIILTCLAVSTFYAYLDIDLRASRRKISKTVTTVVNGWMLLRWGGGIALLLSGWVYQGPDDLYKVLWILFWMVPPALSTPVMSILWGGNLYPSAVLSKALSIFVSVALVSLLSVVMLPISPSSLEVFYIILVFGLVVPGMVAQLWRTKSPVESNHHSKNWKFIGIFAGAMMAFSAGLQFTPAHLISDVFLGADAKSSLACLQQLGIALFSLLLMRGLAALAILLPKNWSNKAEAQDAYLLLVTPNFFLWASLLSGASVMKDHPILQYAVFWAAFGFFFLPLIEQLFFMNVFTRQMLREALRSSRVTAEDAHQLFQHFDIDNNRALDKAELVELLRFIEDKTTGQQNAEDIRPYVAEQLFAILDSDQSGSIDIHKFENYLSRHGLVVNLNVA
ncbi:MAG: histidine phosphatase family protein [Cyanobacteria bacterium P01_F01_bin.13]